MNNPDPKTLEEHQQYLSDIVHLQLWFAWYWQSTHQDEDFKHIFRERVDIFRKTDMNPGNLNPRTCNWDDPVWQELEANVCQFARKYDNDADTFEAAAFDVVWPTVLARSERDFNERPYVRDYKCGSLTFDKPPENNPQRAFMHVANALTPRSIFEDPQYLPDCLRQVMDKSAEEYNATEITTTTWLNDHPAWQRLFPALWMERMDAGDQDARWHFGFWGQFINARGTFNHKLGQRMRETGRFPFSMRSSWCTHDELRTHLDTLV